MRVLATCCLIFATLSSCASLPSAPPVNDPTLSATLQTLAVAPNARLSLCETDAGAQSCTTGSAGLKATGLGGVFLPLDTTLNQMTLRAGEADFDIRINGLAASCATSPISVDATERKISASGFYCNWAGIGNVLATVELTADWQDAASQTFGGRYRIQFNGTGNGAGAGTFRAKIQ